MTRIEALSHHAHMRAAVNLALWLSICGAGTLAIMPIELGDTLLLASLITAFSAMTAGLATDLRSMRIPNELSLMLIGAALLGWVGQYFGGTILPRGSDGVIRDVMAVLIPQSGSGPLVPALATGLATIILLDLICMIIVFIPLYLAFALRLGFGGGDVKLMTAGALYFGWPLGFDFLALTYFVGTGISALFLVARAMARYIIPAGPAGGRRDKLARLRSFPYAPAIVIAAAICFSIQIGGIFQ